MIGIDPLNARGRLSWFFFSLSCLITLPAGAGITMNAGTVQKKMEAAYALIRDYQTWVDVRTYRDGGTFDAKEFLYTFKKPHFIRIDMKKPYAGAIMTYPDKNGKVTVQLPGLARFLKLHLSPDSRFLRERSGQPLNRTDMGTLIEHISHSLADQRRGPVAVEEKDGLLEIRVQAVDHFQKDVITLYRFLIDPRTWLPVGIRESTPEDRLKRSINFSRIRINTDVPESFFSLNKE